MLVAIRLGVGALFLAAAIGAAWAGETPRTEADPLAKIGHVVIVFEENRSFDNLFGLFPGANNLFFAGQASRQVARDGSPLDTLPAVMDATTGKPVTDPRFPADLPNAPFLIERFVPLDVATGDLVHRFYQEQEQIDGGRMDKYAAISDAGGLTMGYYDASSTMEWRLARDFTLGDAMFHSAFGGSFLNHSFLVCSCAFAWPGAPSSIVAQVDAEGRVLRDGQVSPDGYAINTSRSVYLHAPKDADPSRLVPPQLMPHIGDRLDAVGVSWTWYSGGYNDAMAGQPSRLFQFHHQPLAYFADLAPGSPGQRAHLKDLADLYDDIAANRLPQVVFYKPIGELNQHPGYATIAAGDAHLADLIAKLEASPAYADMLILITYDENGGLWDHVAPPHRDRWGPGTRIPLIAVGPSVKRHFIDHTQYDFGSILRTIELRFGAEPLDDADAQAAPMTNLLQ